MDFPGLPGPSVGWPGAARLTADVRRVVGKCDSKLWANIGYDPMCSPSVPQTSHPIWDLIRTSRAFRYIRCHNTFSDVVPYSSPEQLMGCRIYSEDRAGGALYNFDYLDHVLDTWMRAGLKPILEMDFMPDALADGEIMRNYGGGAINAPRHFAKWREMIHRTVQHLIERYGTEEVRTWYFEME